MKIVVFDDDLRMAQNSEMIIRQVADNAGVGCDIAVFSDVKEFQKQISEIKTDIAVLDIAVAGDENFGIESAKRIRKNNKNAHIIFVTSNEDKISRVFAGMIRPTQFILKNTGSDELSSVIKEIFMEATVGEKIRITYGRAECFLSAEEVVCISKNGRKTLITLNDRLIETADTLSVIYKRLGEEFIWADKGTIVNREKIKEVIYPEKRIVMTNGKQIYMSRNAAKEIKKCLTEAG